MWTVHGIFGKYRYDYLRAYVDRFCATIDIQQVIYLAKCDQPLLVPMKAKFFNLAGLSNQKGFNATILNDLVDERTLLIVDNCELIFNYPQSTTRNLINFISPNTPYKIIMGEHLIGKKMSDLYAPFAALDKAILFANHYWCFAEEHMEESVFDKSIIYNKDVAYCAEKILPFVHTEVIAQTEVQEAFYAQFAQHPRARLHSLTHLEI